MELMLSLRDESRLYQLLAFIFFLLLSLICTSGLVSNIMSLSIFLNRRFRRLSINIFLAAISISDLALLIISIPVYISGPLLRCAVNMPLLQHIYIFSIVYLFPITNMFHCTSIWILVAVTIERWFAICRPFAVVVTCTRKRAIIISCLIASFSILYNLVRFLDFKISPDWRAPEAFLRANRQYVFWYTNISNLLLVYVLPMSILLFYNIRMAHHLHKNRCIRRLLAGNLQQGTYDQQAARMLTFVACCFVICYTPCLILDCVEAFKPHLFSTHVGYILSDLTNTAVLFKAASSALFYYRFSRRYRSAAKQLISSLSPKLQLVDTSRTSFRRLYRLVDASPSISRSKRSIVLNELHYDDGSRSREGSFLKSKSVSYLEVPSHLGTCGPKYSLSSKSTSCRQISCDQVSML